MSRQIDTDKPLSDEDLQYLVDRNETVALERARAADAGRDFKPDPGGVKAVEDMTVEELKDELKERDLPHSGNKDELQQRVIEAREGLE